MSENSAIEWTTHTFNPWEGCTKVSPGCAHCYAETRNARFGGGSAPNWGKGKPRRRTSPANWKLPLKWNREQDELTARFGSRTTDSRPRVFCASLADWLDDEVPIDWLADLLAIIAATPNLDWLLLTKRPQNWRTRMEAVWDLLSGETDSPPCGFGNPRFNARCLVNSWLCGPQTLQVPPNVWLGTSVEDQQRADERIPLLLAIPAKVRFLSCEPLLGHVDLTHYTSKQPSALASGKLHWIICGGESGTGARAMHPGWAQSLRDQCALHQVAFLFKQWGEWQPLATTTGRHTLPFGSYVLPTAQNTGFGFLKTGKKSAGRLLDGIEHNQYPSLPPVI